MEGLLMGRQRVVNASLSWAFSLKNIGILDDDDHDPYIYDDYSYLERVLPPRTAATPPMIVELTPRGSKHGREIKIQPPNPMLQRLPMLLAQVQAGNRSENLLNVIRQIVYLLYWVKQISKRVCNNLLKPV